MFVFLFLNTENFKKSFILTPKVGTNLALIELYLSIL